MNKHITKFKQRFDNISIQANFQDIKERINYKDYQINQKERIHKLIYLSPVLIIIIMALVIIPIVINQDTSPASKDLSYEELLKYEVKLDSYSNDVKVEDSKIRIDYPMMVKGCNLSNSLNFNTNWDVYDNGNILDKDNIALNLGTNNYTIRLYKLNQVSKVYDLEIQVGE